MAVSPRRVKRPDRRFGARPKTSLTRLRLGTGENGFPAIYVTGHAFPGLASGIGREDGPRRLRGHSSFLVSLVTGQKRTRSNGMITATIRGHSPRRGLRAGTFNRAAGRGRT